MTPEPEKISRPADEFRSRPEFRRGRAAERLIAQRIREQGWHTVEASLFSGEEGDERPALKGKSAELALPDLLIARAGQLRWVELKLKAKPATDSVSGKQVHGVSARLVREYLQVQAETGVIVMLAVFEEDTRLLLVSRLDDLLTTGRLCASNTLHRGGTWFFARDDFKHRWKIAG
jgi:hypothetical protein